MLPLADGRQRLAGFVTLALAGIVIWGLWVGAPEEGDRIEALGAQIRCPVCQGEAILDSPAPYARDMMAFVEEKVEAGWTDEQILSYLEERFDGIRLDPRFSGTGALLWILPVIFVLAGVYMAARRLVRPRPDRP